VAIEDNGMAKIFAAQGRYGAALAAMKEALNIVQQSKETTSLTVEVVGGWGDLQAQVGRSADGRASLEQALHIAQQIQNNWAAALATNWIGDAAFYQGDNAGARQQYDHALDIASKTADKETILLSKVNRAKTDLAMGHAAAVIPDLKKLAQDADAAGLKSLSVECAFYLDDALAQTKGSAAAQQDLSLTLARAENLGLRILQAKVQALQGSLLAKSGRASDAAIHDREAVRILDTISKEENSAQILNRADLKSLYAETRKALAGSH
jgi:tetratricopeptide (TPR) repeat protein